MTAAIFAILLLPPVDPNELLRRVADRYESFQQFLLEVRETSTRPADPIRVTVHKRLAAAPGDRFFLEVRGVFTRSIVADGRTVRIRQPDSNKPFHQQLGQSAHQHVESEIDSLLRRYAMLASAAPSARLLRQDNVKTASGTVPCAVIQVHVRSAENTGWRETLWIDPRRALILRSDLAPDSPSAVRVYREFWLPPGEQFAPDGLFQLIPLPASLLPPSPSSPSRRRALVSEIPPP